MFLNVWTKRNPILILSAAILFGVLKLILNIELGRGIQVASKIVHQSKRPYLSSSCICVIPFSTKGLFRMKSQVVTETNTARPME